MVLIVVCVKSVPLSLRGVSSSSSSFDASPADDVVRGLEKVVATTFLKLNRTVGAKSDDDKKLANELEEATHVLQNHNQAVVDAKACVQTRTNDARVARETFEKLVQEKNDLNASIADLKRYFPLLLLSLSLTHTPFFNNDNQHVQQQQQNNGTSYTSEETVYRESIGLERRYFGRKHGTFENFEKLERSVAAYY